MTANVADVVYGQWAEENPSCASRIGGTGFQVIILQLCWSVINACQSFFFATRYPEVGWENILVPFVEAVVYGLGYSGIGYMRLYDGRIVVLTRFSLWFLTTPVLLMQVGSMAKVYYRGFEMNNMQVAAAQIMIVFGLGASVAEATSTKWVLFLLACVCMILIGLVTYCILYDVYLRFKEQGSPEALEVSARIQALGYIMLLSWLAHPILYTVSPEGTCAASESDITISFIVADFFAKNCFGVLYWHTLFRKLSGSWTVGSLRETVENPTQNMSKLQVNPPVDESRAPTAAPNRSPSDAKKDGEAISNLQVTADVVDRRRASVAEKERRPSGKRVGRDEDDDDDDDVDFRMDPRDGTFRDVNLLQDTPQTSLSLVPASWQHSSVGNSARRLAGELSGTLGSGRPGTLAGRGEVALNVDGRGTRLGVGSMETLGLSRQRARVGGGLRAAADTEEVGDVFEHVRSLNDALSSLLVTEGVGIGEVAPLDRERGGTVRDRDGRGEWRKRGSGGLAVAAGLGGGTGMLDPEGGLLTTTGLENGVGFNSALGKVTVQGLGEV